MDVSILHVGVRVHPELVVQVVALVGGVRTRVTLDRGAIEQLLGPELGDEKVMAHSLERNMEMIRVAIGAYIAARGMPMDRAFVLSWRDFSPATQDLRRSAEHAVH